MHTMSHDEAIAFLSEGTRTGKLATASLDGRPHVAPVWFVVDGDAVVFTTGEGTVKGRNLAANPRASLAVDDQAFPYSFVVVSGPVSFEAHPPNRLEWTTRLAARYVPAAMAAEYGKRNDVDGELLVRLHMERLIAQAELAG